MLIAWQLRVLGGLALALGAWPILRLVRRVTTRQPPRTLGRLRGAMLLVVGAVLCVLGAGALDLAASLAGYRHLGARARVAELQCAELRPGLLRVYLVPLDADGRRGATQVHTLDGTGWRVTVDRVRFRGWTETLGLTRAFRLLGVTDDGQPPHRALVATTPFDHGLAALTVTDEERMTVTGPPDRRALYEIYVTDARLTVERRSY